MKEKIKEFLQEEGDEILETDASDIEVMDKLEGAYNLNYPVSVGEKKLMMRFSPIREGPHKKYEYKVLKLIEDMNVAPKPYYLDTSLGFFDYPFLIEEWIEGERIRELSSNDMVRLAELFYKINSVKSYKLKDKRFDPQKYAVKASDQVERLIGKEVIDVEFLYELEETLPSIVNYIEDRKDIFPQEESIGLSNTDMKAIHILRTDKGFKIVDWEYAGLDYGSHDIGEFLYHLHWRNIDFDEKKRRKFMERYKELSGTSELEERVKVQMVFFCIDETLWCMRHLIDLRENRVPDPMLSGEKIDNYREILRRNLNWVKERVEI